MTTSNKTLADKLRSIICDRKLNEEQRLADVKKLVEAEGRNACADASTNASADASTSVNAYTYGYTALHLAARCARNSIVEFLIEQKTEVDAGLKSDTATRKFTPLMEAAYSGNAETVRILLNAKADVHAKNRLGETVLHLARNSASDGNTASNGPEKTALLLKANADVTAVDNYGCAALFYAVTRSDEGSVRFLVEAKSGINLRAVDGETPLEWVISKRASNILQALLPAPEAPPAPFPKIPKCGY